VRETDGVVRVLLVDDQETFRTALRDVVAGVGGMVLVGEAGSGEDAVDAADRLQPELVLMDVRMPGMGGIEATRLLTARRPGTVVLLVSVDELDDGEADSCGAAAFLRKQRISPRAVREAWQAHGPA
jgi:two-component system, NarL family, invasion response regulator UvrY